MARRNEDDKELLAEDIFKGLSFERDDVPSLSAPQQPVATSSAQPYDPLSASDNYFSQPPAPSQEVLYDPLSASGDYVLPSSVAPGEVPYDPLSESSDYVPPHLQQGGQVAVSEPEPLTRNNMGTEYFAVDETPLAVALGAEEMTAPESEPITRKNMGTEYFTVEEPSFPVLTPAAPEMTADQQRDAEMGWGPGGSVLVRADEEMSAMDRARQQAADALRSGGIGSQDGAATGGPANLRISQLLSGGEQTATAPKAPESAVVEASKSISQRLAGVLSPQPDSAPSVNTANLPQRGGGRSL